MALSKPVLRPIPAWDAGDGQNFPFSVSGGDIVIGNNLYIIDNDSGETVYQLQTNSYSYNAFVPPNSAGLSNGTYYSAYVETFGYGYAVSEPSDLIQFYCYSTPTWELNITNNMIVQNSSVEAIIHYFQVEGELLNSYSFSLYNNSQTEIATSGTLYDSSGLSDVSLSYTFENLENNMAYYLRVVGTTMENTVLDTGYIRFLVNFEQLTEYNVLYVKNNCDEGYINYYSTAYSIEGTYDGTPTQPEFVDNTINLKNASVIWNNDNEISVFNIPDNFTLKVFFNSPNYDVEEGIIILKGNDVNIALNCIVYPFDSTKIVGILKVSIAEDETIINLKDNYLIYSNLIAIPSEEEKIAIILTKQGNMYDIVLEAVQ